MNGAVLQLVKVSRLHMGAYLCIASNGVPPSVSKRVMLVVHCESLLFVSSQYLTLQCNLQFSTLDVEAKVENLTACFDMGNYLSVRLYITLLYRPCRLNDVSIHTNPEN